MSRSESPSRFQDGLWHCEECPHAAPTRRGLGVHQSARHYAVPWDRRAEQRDRQDPRVPYPPLA